MAELGGKYTMKKINKLVSEKKFFVAGITTEFRTNSHSEVQLGRLIKGYNLDGTPDHNQLRSLKLASLYVDQFPASDLSRQYTAEQNIPLYEGGIQGLKDALTLGTGTLAVDAVYLCLEHGNYPVSETGNKQYPKLKFFKAVVEVFEENNRVVPVFMDKHLADNWKDAKWIYDKSKELSIPMLAGSSLPIARRKPAINMPIGVDLAGVEGPVTRRRAEIVGNFTGGLDSYSFHILEFIQSFVERRAGGETGVKAVQTFKDAAVWEAGENGLFDEELLLAALSSQNKIPERTGYFTKNDLPNIKEQARNPVVFIIEYVDGLKVSLFSIPNLVCDNAFSWRTNDPDQPIRSVCSDSQSARPYTHHGQLMEQFQQMVVTGVPGYPVERTLLVSGVVDECLRSLNVMDSARIETPFLEFSYEADWEWSQPPRYLPDNGVTSIFRK